MLVLFIYLIRISRSSSNFYPLSPSFCICFFRSYTHTSGNTSLKPSKCCLKPFVSCSRQKADDRFQRLRWPFHTAVYPWDLSEPTGSNMMQGARDKDHKDSDKPPEELAPCLCFCLLSRPRAALTAHRLPLIVCDSLSHLVNWQLVLITTCHTRSETLWHYFCS